MQRKEDEIQKEIKLFPGLIKYHAIFRCAGQISHSFTHSYPRKSLEMSGHLHGPATLSPGKEPQVEERCHYGHTPNLVYGCRPT